MTRYAVILSILISGATVFCGNAVSANSRNTDDIETVPPIPDYFVKSLAANPVDILDDRYVLKSFRIAASIGNWTARGLDNTSPGETWMSCHVELSSFTDSLMGNIWRHGFSMVLDTGRRRSKKNPGFYLNGAGWSSNSALSQFERDSLFNSVDELLQDRFHMPRDSEFVSIYRNVLGDSTRTEFFGRTDIEDVKISIGGWFGKFASIAVFDDYGNVNSFLKKANEYFRLPAVNKEDIITHKRGDEFLYSVRDEENMTILRGYRVIVNCPVIFTGLRAPIKSLRVIELIKYYDKDFMP